MSVFSEMKSISPTRPYLKPTIKTDSQGLSTTFQLEVPPRSRGQPVCGHPENTYTFQAGDRIVVKQLTRNKKQQNFAYGPETTVVAVTRTAVLTEHSSIWIHASRAKLVKKGPDPRETGKEVLTGAESPDLEQDNQGKGVLTGGRKP
ncbi:unnamed protein product [Staurois parvus]|uniref:Uncharacterized protein n=1 Tax=Staurois parvus TaxID=386267 RepID=A0ABN9GB67_9NEOB|nr:unnamed protein product [Staurois parvus]